MQYGEFEPVARLLFGLIILLAGRNVFWLTIAAVGFLMGFELATPWLGGQGAWTAVVAGLGCGLAGALLAVLFQRLGFVLAGFFTAAFGAIVLLPALGMHPGPPVLVIGAGLVGGVLAALLTDWAIIALSALAGAAAIVSVLVLAPVAQFVTLVVLVVIGIAAQRTLMLRARR